MLERENASEIVEQVIEDYHTADISEAERETLKYAEKLTSEPASITEKDLQTLREKGFSDRDILDINQVVSYFNYVNRIADGLGIELEE